MDDDMSLEELFEAADMDLEDYEPSNADIDDFDDFHGLS